MLLRVHYALLAPWWGPGGSASMMMNQGLEPNQGPGLRSSPEDQEAVRRDRMQKGKRERGQILMTFHHCHCPTWRVPVVSFLSRAPGPFFSPFTLKLFIYR